MFDADFCAPRRGNEKGHVENGVGYVRRNFLVPIPEFATWEELNAHLADCCRRDRAHAIGRRPESIDALLPADVAAMTPLPVEAFLARRLESVVVNSLGLGRFDGNDYSVPTRFAHQTLTAVGTVDAVSFRHHGEVVARHRRCWQKRQTIYDPLHYLALLERKTKALDQAAPLAEWNLPPAFAMLRQRLEAADREHGTRQFIRVLRLCEVHELAAVAAAIERALTLEVIDADAVRLILERAAEVEPASLDLSGRSPLGGVRVPIPNLSAYRDLMPQGAAS